MAPMYYRGAHAALLVYDVTSAESFEAVDVWVKELRQNLPDEVVMVVVGNKTDLRESCARPVSQVVT